MKDFFIKVKANKKTFVNPRQYFIYYIILAQRPIICLSRFVKSPGDEVAEGALG